MDKSLAYAIIKIAACGIGIGEDFSDKVFASAERGSDVFAYQAHEARELFRERFHCLSIIKEYERRYGCDNDLLADAISFLSEAADTTAVIAEAEAVLLDDMHAQFKVNENPDIEIRW